MIKNTILIPASRVNSFWSLVLLLIGIYFTINKIIYGSDSYWLILRVSSAFILIGFALFCLFVLVNPSSINITLENDRIYFKSFNRNLCTPISLENASRIFLERKPLFSIIGLGFVELKVEYKNCDVKSDYIISFPLYVYDISLEKFQKNLNQYLQLNA